MLLARILVVSWDPGNQHQPPSIAFCPSPEIIVILVISPRIKKSDNDFMDTRQGHDKQLLKILQNLADNALSLKKANQSKGWGAKPLA